jgi:putative transposase
LGYTCILGELKKLGVRAIAKSTVKNILKEHGLDPGPARGEDSWGEFLARHAATLWACDFFTRTVWTLRGRVDVYVLFFIHLASRRVHVAGLTTNPNRAWMVQQARNTSMVLADEAVPARVLFRDRDAKFVAEFDDVFESDGVAVRPVGPLAPNLNAYTERGCRASTGSAGTASPCSGLTTYGT